MSDPVEPSRSRSPRSDGEGPVLDADGVTVRVLDRDARTLRAEVRRGVTDVGVLALEPVGQGAGQLSWSASSPAAVRGDLTRAVQLLVAWALAPAASGLGLTRVQAKLPLGDHEATAVVARSGFLREGVERHVPTAEGGGDLAVYARLRTDLPLGDPRGFRTVLNASLPRKRAIAQLLVRDDDDRVLMCQLTYKRDWDLPGGVVEVGESPRVAVVRELVEELGLSLEAGALLLTDWLPPWSGWDDALCLVFDGGRQPSNVVRRIVKQEKEIRDAQFLTLEQVRDRATDFTARRVEAALAGNRRYTESGR